MSAAPATTSTPTFTTITRVSSDFGCLTVLGGARLATDGILLVGAETAMGAAPHGPTKSSRQMVARVRL
jgi:hypothetical protein